MAYAFLDAIWQAFCYYTMGALSNNPRKLAYYAGFYKSVQAVGATVVSKLDGDKAPISAIYGSSWGLMAAGLLCALPVYIWRMHDTELSEAELEGDSVKVDDKSSTVE